MKFEKRNFMGIELDVLVGHPEHELLFVATQVARTAGLKNPVGLTLRDAIGTYHSVIGFVPRSGNGRSYAHSTVLLGEEWVYKMLLAGNAPQSEPFRKWVTEEVLPTIRKTGNYKAEDSQNPIALAIMDELKSLRGEIVQLRQELQAKTFSLEELPTPEVSPYEGQSMVALHDPAGFNEKTYRELAESHMPLTAVAKLMRGAFSLSACL